MPLIKNGEVVEDSWVRIGGEAPIPDDGDVIIDATRLKDDPAVRRKRSGRLGVLLQNTADPNALKGLLGALSLIALEFPSFNDGRAFSQARVLRHQLGFKGEIRAIGKPMADQAAYLIRCGFDAFEVSGAQPLDIWRKAAALVTRAYQRGYSAGAGKTRGEA